MIQSSSDCWEKNTARKYIFGNKKGEFGIQFYLFFFFFFFQRREGSFAAFNWPASRAANFNGLRPDVCSFSSPPACIYFLYINLNSYKSGDWLSISLITDKIVVVVVVVGNAVLKMLEQLGISSVKKRK